MMRRLTSTEASREMEEMEEVVEVAQAEAKAVPERTSVEETGSEEKTAVDKGDLKEGDQMETIERGTGRSIRKAANVETIAMTSVSDRTGTKRKEIPTQRPIISGNKQNQVRTEIAQTSSTQVLSPGSLHPHRNEQPDLTDTRLRRQHNLRITATSL